MSVLWLLIPALAAAVVLLAALATIRKDPDSKYTALVAASALVLLGGWVGMAAGGDWPEEPATDVVPVRVPFPDGSERAVFGHLRPDGSAVVEDFETRFRRQPGPNQVVRVHRPARHYKLGLHFNQTAYADDWFELTEKK